MIHFIHVMIHCCKTHRGAYRPGYVVAFSDKDTWLLEYVGYITCGCLFTSVNSSRRCLLQKRVQVADAFLQSWFQTAEK